MDKTIVISASVIICLGIFILYGLLKKRFEQRLLAIETQIASNEFVVCEIKSLYQQHLDDYQKHSDTLKSWQLEHQQVSQQLEHRIKVLQEKLLSYQDQLSQIQQQQPEDRLYTRAQKMVALGADVDELVNECGLPVAEAEILIAMHRRKN